MGISQIGSRVINFRFTMSRRLLLFTISGALVIPSFIRQDADACQFKTQESSILSTGTYVFQQLQSLRFDFIILAKGKCPDPPLVYLRDEASISMAGSMTTDKNTIRLFGEIKPPGKHLILVAPSAETCDFEIQKHSSLSVQLPNCQVGVQFPIDFEPETTQNEAELMNDFVAMLDDPQEIPESVSGLLLIDGIRDYVSRSKRERNGLQANAYRQIRDVFIKIQPLITGDLSQQKEAEATARAACVHLNSFITNPRQRAHFKTIKLSGFNSKWKNFALKTTFPRMIIESKESHLGQCQVSNTTPGFLSAGAYVFRHLLQVRELQSLRFDFQVKASVSASCLDHLPSVTIAANDMTTTTTEAGMIRIVGNIQSPYVGKELILTIPASPTCVYQLVQAALTLQTPALDEVCQIGQTLIIEWEESEVLDPAMLEVIGAEMSQNIQDVDETVKDLTRDAPKIPKVLAGLSVIDGIWNCVRFNYEATWMRLSREDRKGVVYVYRKLRYIYKRLERYIRGDMSQKSNVEATVRAACEHLNSLISNPQEQVDFQTVSLAAFQTKWIKVVSTKPTSAAEDPSQLPTHVVEIRAIDAIYNYVVYDYKRQWEVLSKDKKHLKSGY